MKIIRSSLILSMLTISGSILGLISNVLLASHWGLSKNFDTYFFVLSIPLFASSLLSSSISYRLTPIISSLEDRIIDLKKIIASSMSEILWIATIITILGITLGPFFQSKLFLQGPKLEQGINLTLSITLGWIIFFTQVALGFLTALLNGTRRFYSASLINLFPYIGSLICIGIFKDTLTVTHLLLGLLFGLILAVGISSILTRSLLLGSFEECFALPKINSAYSRILGSTLASSCFSFQAISDAIWAIRTGEGNLSAINLSSRIIIGSCSLIISGPSVLLIPIFTDLIKQGNANHFRKKYNSVIGIIMLLGSILALAILFFGADIVAHLFLRNQFNSVDVDITSNILVIMALGSIFMIMSVISLRILFCFPGQETYGAVIGSTWCLIYFLGSMFFYPKGIDAIAWTYVVSWALYFMMIYLHIRKISELSLERASSK